MIELQKIDIFGDMGAFMFARDFMRERGYREPAQWRTTVYPGADHNEASWAVRLPEVLHWWLVDGERD